jgi:hypothetical protein
VDFGLYLNNNSYSFSWYKKHSLTRKYREIFPDFNPGSARSPPSSVIIVQTFVKSPGFSELFLKYAVETQIQKTRIMGIPVITGQGET